MFFAFAGSGFILSSPLETIHACLPSEVIEILNDHEFATCQSLSTNELGGYFIAYQDINDRSLNVRSDALDWQFPEFQSWLSQHDSHNTKLVMCGDSYVGWNTAGSFIWHGVDDLLVQLMKTKGNIKGMALGVEGAFVILWENGTCDWKGLEKYNGLNELLHASNINDIEFVALNPSKAGEFFLLSTDNRAAFVVDHIHVERIRRAVENGNIDIIIDDVEEWAITLALVDHDNSPWSDNDSTPASSPSEYHDAATNLPNRSQERGETPECPICTEDLGRDGPQNLLAGCESCAQMFHGRCVGEWVKSLRAGNMGSRCPNCREALSAEFTEEVLAMLV